MSVSTEARSRSVTPPAAEAQPSRVAKFIKNAATGTLAVAAEGVAPTLVSDVSRYLRGTKIKPESTDTLATAMQGGAAVALVEGHPYWAAGLHAGSKVIEMGEVFVRKVKSKTWRRGR